MIFFFFYVEKFDTNTRDSRESESFRGATGYQENHYN